MGQLLTDGAVWYRVLAGLVALSLCLITSAHAQRSLRPTLSGIPELTPPEFATARAVEDLCPNLISGTPGPTGDLKRRCDELIANSRAGNQDTVRDSLLQMATKEVSNQGTSSIETSNLQFTNITARLAALRHGSAGLSIQGFALHNLETPPQNAMLARLRPDQDSGPLDDAGVAGFPRMASNSSDRSPWAVLAQAQNSGTPRTTAPNPFGRLGLFVNGTFSVGDKDTTNREAGFDFNTYGVTGGMDYRLTDQLVMGMAFGYTTTDTDFAASRGDMNADGYLFSLYGTYYWDRLYVDGVFSYGWNSFDGTRNIVYAIPSSNPLVSTTVNQAAQSDTDGTQYSLSVGTGYDFTLRGFTFGPYGRLNYLRADIDGFRERINSSSDGFGLALAIQGQDVDSLTWVLGGQGSYALSTGFGVLVPQLRLEWEHEFLDDRRTVTASFISDPANTPILLETDQPDRDYLNFGAGLSAVFQRGVSAFLYYETVVALRDVTAHKIAAGLRLAF